MKEQENFITDCNLVIHSTFLTGLLGIRPHFSSSFENHLVAKNPSKLPVPLIVIAGLPEFFPIDFNGTII